MTRRRWAVLLTADTGDRRLLGPWRDRARADRIAGRLQDLVDESDPLVDVDCSVGLVELEPWRGYRAALAWLLADSEVQL